MEAKSVIEEIDINKLYISSKNVRKTTFHVSELVESIKQMGVIEPLIVRKLKDKEGLFEVVAGQRRFVAAKEAGLPRVPAIVKNLTDDEAISFSLVENLHQQSLDVIDATNAIKTLTDIEISKMPVNPAGIHTPWKGRLYGALRKVAEKTSLSFNTLHRYYNIADRMSKRSKEIISKKKMPFEIAYRLSWLPKNVQEEYARELAGIPFKDALKIIFLARDIKMPIKKAIKKYFAEKEKMIRIFLPTSTYEKLFRKAKSRRMAIDFMAADIINRWVKEYG